MVKRRAAAQLKDFEASTKQDRETAVEKEAENRVLIATVRSMQDECYACKVCVRWFPLHLLKNLLHAQSWHSKFMATMHVRLCDAGESTSSRREG